MRIMDWSSDLCSSDLKAELAGDLPRDALPNVVGGRGGPGRIGVGQEHYEFLPAEAGRDGVGGREIHQSPRQRDDHAVAQRMDVGLVERLEMIDVADDKAALRRQIARYLAGGVVKAQPDEGAESGRASRGG